MWCFSKYACLIAVRKRCNVLLLSGAGRLEDCRSLFGWLFGKLYKLDPAAPIVCLLAPVVVVLNLRTRVLTGELCASAFAVLGSLSLTPFAFFGLAITCSFGS